MIISCRVLLAVLGALVFQGCSLSIALPAPDSTFDIWLRTFDFTSIQGERQSPSCAGQSDDFYPFPNECSANYFGCVNGTQYNQTCSSSSTDVFDPVLGSCVLLRDASCKGLTTTLLVTTSRPPFTCYPQEDGVFAVGPCSSSYYRCIGGQLFPEKCPVAGAVFNPANGFCTSPSNVQGCATTISPATTEVTSSAPNITVSTILVTASTAVSGSPQVSTTSSSSSATTTGTCPTPLPGSFHCPSPEGNFPIPGAPCETADYYVCVSCSPYVRTCPGNSSFDQVAHVCKSKDKLSCNQAFSCPVPDGDFPVKLGVCSNAFYKCVDGVPYNQTCPGSSLFHPTEKKCKSSCSVLYAASIPLSYSDQERCFGKPDGFYPFNENECRRDYIICVSDNEYIQPSDQICPDGSIFDPDAKICVPLRSSSC